MRHLQRLLLLLAGLAAAGASAQIQPRDIPATGEIAPSPVVGPPSPQGGMGGILPSAAQDRQHIAKRLRDSGMPQADGARRMVYSSLERSFVFVPGRGWVEAGSVGG